MVAQKIIIITPVTPLIRMAGAKVMSHRTMLSCWWARDRAHKRRYEAVCETLLRQNSIANKHTNQTFRFASSSRREEGGRGKSGEEEGTH